MTVVYPLAFNNDFIELKYSLRSIEMFLKKPFEVVIVGSVMPEWITNVIQIAVNDIQGQPLLSVRRKALAAIHYAGEVFYMNDDFYLLQKTDKHFPYYYSGLLDNKPESGAKPLVKQLQALDKPTNYFGHYPCIYRKNFAEIISNFSADCITKSAYCNMIEGEKIEIADCKIVENKKPEYIREFIKDKPCFSTGVYSLKNALPVLQEFFPEKSIYEI